jgi:hypothetical protein
LGIGEALFFAQGECFKVVSTSTNKAFGDSSFGEVVQGVDDFYREPASLRVEVPAAMNYFQMKVQGTKPETLAEILADYRRKAAADK